MQKEDSLYRIVFAVTTLVIVLALSTAGTVALLQQKQETVLSSSSTGFSPLLQGTTAITSATSKTSSETWVLKGTAIGKGVGNETGDPFMAEVIRLSDGRYRMYYGWTKMGATGIKSAISTDGKTFTAESGFRLQGASDKNDREAVVSGPSIVILPDGRMRMYYQSSAQQAQGETPAYHVRSAITSDGLTFTKEGIRIDIAPYITTTGLSLAGHGSYFKVKDGTVVGIFSANFSGQEKNPSSLVMATSKDGLTFSNFKVLYEKWHDPIILKTATGYVIYATYLTEKQGKAVSTDGVTWPSQMTDIVMQDSTGKRLTEGNSGVGDIGGVVLPDGSIRLYVNYGSQQKSDSVAYVEKQ